ncbi:glycosyltransferase [Streptomyces liangshanensis]|uniref:D-inositol 3-phosphate glycosyltransferase n=2 Tax=Streptomyces liangshanensis TaxID=2717324 RepID=A0A6G9H8W9_9ACTN|nr:glycosyltransferase [Streptomyces liangshanensis]
MPDPGTGAGPATMPGPGTDTMPTPAPGATTGTAPAPSSGTGTATAPRPGTGATTGTAPAPNPGAAPASPAASAAAPLLLCVATVSPRKGQLRLVDALVEVADLGWRCVLVGGLGQDPGYVARVRERIDAAGLGARIRLAGPRTGPALAATYAQADLLVLASRAETYGMAVTEALARGIPVLATAVGGVPEALGQAPDGTLPGALVPPDDPAALTAALRRWLAGPDERRRCREAARRRRTTLAGWDTTARSLAEVLERLPHEPRRTA